MKRLRLALLPAAMLLVLGSTLWQGIAAGGNGGGLCAHMTPARMLENPALAHEWAEALRSASPSEVARVRAMLDEIRAAHGCQGEVAMPDASAPRLPPGHPPLPSHPSLPQDHPPLPSSPAPMFSRPDVVTI